MDPVYNARLSATRNIERIAINLARFALVQDIMKTQGEARAIAFNWFHKPEDRALAMCEIQFGDDILCRIAEFNNVEDGISA